MKKSTRKGRIYIVKGTLWSRTKTHHVIIIYAILFKSAENEIQHQQSDG